MAANVRGFANF